MAKDLFSRQAELYARFRPRYPSALFAYILQFVPARQSAWDCATGNGQAAAELAHYFETVEATDISEAQLQHATQKPNIHYSIAAAEQTNFPDGFFDLITVAQAYHWFNWKAFHDEATRVAKPGAVVAIWTYNLFTTEDEAVQQIIHHFYKDVVGPYWEYERRYVDEGYRTVDFDFDELPPQAYAQIISYGREDFLQFLETWSAVQTYRKRNHASPLDVILPDLEAAWPAGETRDFRLPYYLRLGRVKK